MKWYIIAGEASGDLHGSNLMKELKKQDEHANFRFWGGDLMQEQAGKPVKHIKDLAFMGFAEVISNLRTILGNIKLCKADILDYQPDAIILIDYPGFNLRIAEFCKKNNIPVLYYISPQVWAWKKGRVHKIKRIVDEMYTILPFEKDFYANYDYEVNYVGHPLIDAIQNFKKSFDKDQFLKANKLEHKKIIALLPGSRKQEIKKKLPIMLKMTAHYPGYHFVIAGAPAIEEEYYEQFTSNSNIQIIYNKTYALLQSASCALVTSGTATLETALFKVPEVVCYKGSPISYQIAKRVIDIKYISLVNLILDRELVTELIQNEFNEKNLKRELDLILAGEKREQVLEGYDELERILGGTGASSLTASEMLKTITDLKREK